MRSRAATTAIANATEAMIPARAVGDRREGRDCEGVGAVVLGIGGSEEDRLPLLGN